MGSVSIFYGGSIGCCSAGQNHLSPRRAALKLYVFCRWGTCPPLLKDCRLVYAHQGDMTVSPLRLLYSWGDFFFISWLLRKWWWKEEISANFVITFKIKSFLFDQDGFVGRVSLFFGGNQIKQSEIVKDLCKMYVQWPELRFLYGHYTISSSMYSPYYYYYFYI